VRSVKGSVSSCGRRSHESVTSAAYKLYALRRTIIKKNNPNISPYIQVVLNAVIQPPHDAKKPVSDMWKQAFSGGKYQLSAVSSATRLSRCLGPVALCPLVTQVYLFGNVTLYTLNIRVIEKAWQVSDSNHETCLDV